MIGKVSGRLEYRAADHVLIEVGAAGGGIGYLVYCSDRTLAAMPPPGGPVALYTELMVREDLMQLFGFPTIVEREWHRLLMSVQGVGAKAALGILGALGAEGLARALALGDATAFRAAPGVGPKIAQRLVLELKAKSPAMIALGRGAARPAAAVPVAAAAGAGPGGAGGGGTVTGAMTAIGTGAAASAEALSALVNLGYAPGEAAAAVAEVGAEPGLATPALIRAALQRLAPRV